MAETRSSERLTIVAGAAVIALTGWLLSSIASPAFAAPRVALVIGNAAYKHTIPLANPRNDAQDMARVLRLLDFEVIEGLDLGKAGFEGKLEAFAEAAMGAETTLFFYAGHALQVDGENYLIPTDARLGSEAHLVTRAFTLAAFMKAMRSPTKLVFLDACRDNPLAQGLARSMGATRSAAVRRGLEWVESASGTLIAYATQPGNVADDGKGRNSPFTAALLAHIDTPGQSVNDLLTLVTNAVVTGTNGRQQPWTHSSLLRPFYFKPEEDEDTVSGTDPTDDANSARLKAELLAADRTFWASIKRSEDPADFQAYLKKYPQGEYVYLARNRLKQLRPALVTASDIVTRDIHALDEKLASLVVTAHSVLEENRASNEELRARIANNEAEAGEIDAQRSRIQSNVEVLNGVIANLNEKRLQYTEVAGDLDDEGEDTAALRKQVRELSEQIDLLVEYRTALEEELDVR